MRAIEALRFRQTAAGGGGGAPFTMGQTTGAVTGGSLSNNFLVGATFLAPVNGVVDRMSITNHSTAGTGAFRLCIYAATSNAVWGALLAQTANQAVLAGNETREIMLTVPLSVNAAQRYALVIHGATGARYMASNTGESRFITDTYADGSPNPAPATSQNSATNRPVIWASGEAS